MLTTPRPIIDSVVRSVCGREVEGVVRIAGGEVNETYRVELGNDVAVVARIAQQPVPWFANEEHVMVSAARSWPLVSEISNGRNRTMQSMSPRR